MPCQRINILDLLEPNLKALLMHLEPLHAIGVDIYEPLRKSDFPQNNKRKFYVITIVDIFKIFTMFIKTDKTKDQNILLIIKNEWINPMECQKWF